MNNETISPKSSSSEQSQMNKFKLFEEWFVNRYSNPNELANDLGINSGRIYRFLVTEKIPDKIAPLLIELGCPIEMEEDNKGSHGAMLKKWLIKHNMTNRELAGKIGIKPQYITNLFSKTKFSKKSLQRFKDAGVDLLNEFEGRELGSETILQNPDLKRVRFVPAKLQAQYAKNSADIGFLNQLPEQLIYASEVGQYRSFEISGDSMEKEFPHGSIIDTKLLDPTLWSKMHRGQVYVFAHNKHGLLVKLVTKQDNRKISLRSINDHYEDMDIDLSEVNEIWYFIQKHDTNRDYSRYLVR